MTEFISVVVAILSLLTVSFIVTEIVSGVSSMFIYRPGNIVMHLDKSKCGAGVDVCITKVNFKGGLASMPFGVFHFLDEVSMYRPVQCKATRYGQWLKGGYKADTSKTVDIFGVEYSLRKKFMSLDIELISYEKKSGELKVLCTFDKDTANILLESELSKNG